MSPSGGLTTLVDQDITWSALNSVPVPSSAKQRWLRAVAGRVQGGEAPAVALDRLAVGEADVGAEAVVAALAAFAGRGQVRAEAERRRAGRGGERRGAGRVVAVGVGDEDAAHPFAARRGEDRGEMRRVRRPRVEHRHASGRAPIR